jgi:hypothetical protein
MWDLWLTNWHCDTFSPVEIIPPMLHIPYSCITNINLAIEGVPINTLLCLPWIVRNRKLDPRTEMTLTSFVSNARAVFC